MHQVEWESPFEILPGFTLTKVKDTLQKYHSDIKFDIVFYDAFGPRAQGDMWEKEVLAKAVDLLDQGGIFVTYCAKGQVRRDLIDLGVNMQRLPGPPGKREMLFGIKKS